MSSKINPITSVLTYLSPSPPKEFHEKAGWEKCSRCTHSLGMVCRGGQGWGVKLVHMVSFQSVARSFPRLNLLQLERPPSVLTSHTCSPLTHFGGLSHSHKTDAGDGEPTEERICFFFPLQKQYVVYLPLITQWGGTKHGIQLVLHFPVQMFYRPPEPPNPAWVLPSE